VILGAFVPLVAFTDGCDFWSLAILHRASAYGFSSIKLLSVTAAGARSSGRRAMN